MQRLMTLHDRIFPWREWRIGQCVREIQAAWPNGGLVLDRLLIIPVHSDDEGSLDRR
jgi:hypothetical protein